METLLSRKASRSSMTLLVCTSTMNRFPEELLSRTSITQALRPEV
jgi:hypothetical protein